MTSTRFAFLLDTPDLSSFAFPDGAPEDLVDGDVAPPTSRIQVAKTGTFKHPRYGKFTVTRATFDSFQRNMPVVLADGTAPIDFDHEPDLGGKTAAVGWITKLIPDGDRLMADVEWTWQGACAIRDRTYKFFSPTWSMNFVDDTGVDRGPALIGGGLTNRPFFNRMAVVNCSQSFTREDLEPATEEAPEAAPEASDSRAAMSTFATIAKQLGLAEDADEAQVLTATRELQTKADREPEIPAGSIVLTAARVAELELKANAGEKAAADLAEMRFSTAFDKAVTEGKAAPAQREALSKIFKADEDTALQLIESLQPIVNTAARGDAGERETEAPEGVDAERYALDRKAQAYAREHNVDYDAALTAVLAQGAGS